MSEQLAILLKQREEIEAKHAEIEDKIQVAEAESMAGAIAAVKSLMESSGVTLEMLGGRKARAPRAPRAASAIQTPKPKALRSTKGAKVAAKYRDPVTCQTWSGRGLTPKWLRAEVAKGKTLESFAVTAEAA